MISKILCTLCTSLSVLSTIFAVQPANSKGAQVYYTTGVTRDGPLFHSSDYADGYLASTPRTNLVADSSGRLLDRSTDFMDYYGNASDYFETYAGNINAGEATNSAEVGSNYSYQWFSPTN